MHPIINLVHGFSWRYDAGITPLKWLMYVMKLIYWLTCIDCFVRLGHSERPIDLPSVTDENYTLFYGRHGALCQELCARIYSLR
jgi:hypothetical protein